jgi:cytosine/adenosine deaminase-related metal-dependent hydrolase
MADTFTLTARYVFPVTAPPLPGGLVTVAGDRIAAVEAHGARAADVDLGDVAIIPGLVNAHTHLDLTGARGKAPPTPDFTRWLRQVIDYRVRQLRQKVEGDIRDGIAECLRFGTTLIGDIAHEGQSAELLVSAPLRSVVFRELIGLSAERAATAWEGFKWWRAAFPDSPTCKPGVSPHAPYSARECLFVMAGLSGLPVATHLAEAEAETELLANHDGPFVPFLQGVNAWDPEGLVPDANRIILVGVKARRALYAHCNYLPADTPIPTRGTVVYCPRTHAAFGHPPHPFRDILARGVRVALGTDSLASNPDLDLLAEARFVHACHPDVPGPTLLRMATLSGAEALRFAGATGSLEPGKSADLAIVALPPNDAADPHELLFNSDRPVIATYFRGKRTTESQRTQRAENTEE